MAEIKTIDLGAVNCYLVNTDRGFILIDTGGCTVFDANLLAIRAKLDRALNNAGCCPGNLKLILITHGDADHTENCVYLREKYRTKIAMHRDDLKLVENPDWDELRKGSRIKSPVMGLIFKIILASKGPQLKKQIIAFQRFTPDFFIDEGFDLAEYGWDAKVLHIPGHTKGSIGILTASGDFFSGDIFNNMRKPGIAPNAYDFKVLESSIARLRQLKITTVYPGHGKPFLIEQFQQK